MKHRVRFSWARRPDSSRTGRTGPDGGKRYHDHRRHDHFWLAGLAGPGSAGGPRTDRARRHPGRAGPSLSREGAALRPAPCSTPGRPSQIGAQTLCSARRRVRDSCDGYRGPRVAGVGMGRGRPSRIGASARRCPFRFAWRSESVSRPVPLAALQVNARTHARARTRIFKCTHFLALRSVSCGALQARLLRVRSRAKARVFACVRVIRAHPHACASASKRASRGRASAHESSLPRSHAPAAPDHRHNPSVSHPHARARVRANMCSLPSSHTRALTHRRRRARARAKARIHANLFLLAPPVSSRASACIQVMPKSRKGWPGPGRPGGFASRRLLQDAASACTHTRKRADNSRNGPRREPRPIV